MRAASFAVVGASADALMNETTSRRHGVSSGNGAAPPKSRPRPRKKTRGRKGITPGTSIARARQVLAQNPEMTITELSQAALGQRQNAHCSKPTTAPPPERGTMDTNGNGSNSSANLEDYVTALKQFEEEKRAIAILSSHANRWT